MSSINRANPAVLAHISLVSLERPAFETDEETGKPDPATFVTLGTMKNGDTRRIKCSPHAFTQLAIGDGTAKRPNPPYLVDPRRRFVMCMDGKGTAATAIRVDMFREQNISYGFKPAPGERVQDTEVEVTAHENGDLFITQFPSRIKSSEHALPILRSLGRVDTITVGDSVAEGSFTVSRIEGRRVFLAPQ